MTELVDLLANEIRSVDGSHNIGAGALAEKLMPFLRLRMSLAAVDAREKALREAAEKLNARANEIDERSGSLVLSEQIQRSDLRANTFEEAADFVLALLDKEEGE